jgi:hypothetical protein
VIMALLGVDIPPLDGHVQLRFHMTKKRTLEMCVFVDSVVLKAVQQRTDKVKITRMAKVEEMIEKRKEMQAVAGVAAVAAAIRKEMQAVAAAAAAASRKEMQTGHRPRPRHSFSKP